MMIRCLAAFLAAALSFGAAAQSFPEMADPDTQAKLRQRGLDPAYLNSERTLELMRRDVARWRDVANRVKLSLD